LAALIPLPEGGGKLFGGDTSRDSFPLLLEGAVVEGDTCELVLHMPKQEDVRRRQIRWIGRVAEDLDAMGCETILDDAGMNRGIVPIEKSTCSTNTGLFFLKCLMKTSRTFTTVVGKVTKLVTFKSNL
jgi:hypothetical protein